MVKTVLDIFGNNIVFGLAANKADLFSEEVSEEEGIEYANEIGAIFRKTSAKKNRDGIKIFINELIEKFLQIKRKEKAEKFQNKFYNLCKYSCL